MDLDMLIEDELLARGELTAGGIAALCRRYPRHAADLIDFYAAWWALTAEMLLPAPPRARARAVPRR